VYNEWSMYVVCSM